MPPSIVLPVRFTGGGLTMQTTSSRLTAEGVFLRCLVAPREGAKVSMQISFPGGTEPADGAVRQRVPAGQEGKEAGFWAEFVGPSPSLLGRIQEFLADPAASRAAAVAAKANPNQAGAARPAPAAIPTPIETAKAPAATPAASAQRAPAQAAAPAPPGPRGSTPTGSELPKVIVPPAGPMPLPGPTAPPAGTTGRRSFPRAAAKLGVRYSSARDFLVAYSDNISRGGIFVATPEPPPIDTVIELWIKLPDGGDPARTQAVVVQRTTKETSRPGHPVGAGLQFIDSDDEFRARLDRCMDYLLEAPLGSSGGE